jgi:nicotinate-nucleotide pyrophosphorylase (carboxylating)
MLKLIDIQADVAKAIAEDVGSGDLTAQLIPKDCVMHAVILSREPMLLCGQDWVNLVFKTLDANLKITWNYSEGAWLEKPTTLCHIYGSSRSILTAERTALNFLQTLSGTATQTYHYVLALKNTNTCLLDTRKTLPGLRLAQKYAVACAGGSNHRFGLYDAFLIKENHIKACGSITQAINAARAMSPDVLLEIEVETLDEFSEALAAKPDRIMLDNFNMEMIKQAVQLNNPKQCKLEISGNVTLETIAQLAKLGVDYISVGALTKSVRAIDLSLLIQDEK